MEPSSVGNSKELWIGEDMRIEFEFENMDNVEIEKVQEVDLNSEHDNLFNPYVEVEKTPKIGQQFESLDEVWNFYNEYAKNAGFSVRNSTVNRCRETNEIVRKSYVCFKEGKSTVVAKPGTSRRRGAIRENCKAKLVVLRSKYNKFVVSIFVEGHSHPLASPTKTHFLRSHRVVSNAQKCLTQQLGVVNIPKHQQYNLLGLQAGGFENVGFTQKDLYKHGWNTRMGLIGRDGDMFVEFLSLEQQKNPSFYFKIESDDENRIRHCFWADATSRRAYGCYGDVVVFDTTYNTNKYSLIFAPLMGVNNHGQTIIYGCAFLSDETIESFIWLFNEFLEAMPGDAPKLIITDQDPAMTRAIAEVLPHTHHRLCSWHILMKFSEKIDVVKYNTYRLEISDCIWNSETKEEFDVKWLDLMTRSGLSGNKWLNSLYEIRSKWVPAYVNHIFSANMTSSQRVESAHSFFKKYVSKNNTLLEFMIQFSRGVMQQRHQELLCDHKDYNEKPKLRLMHFVLVQMVDIYTSEIFHKFQNEMWEMLNYKFDFKTEEGHKNVYEVRKTIGDNQRVRLVSYDRNLDFVSCSCKLFDSAGIPCQHMLAYMVKFFDIHSLPSKYILSRWTKRAKKLTVRDSNGMVITCDKSYFLQRSRLIQRSLDVVERALISPEATKIYDDALDMACEKINLLVDNVEPSQPLLQAPSGRVDVNVGASGGVSVNMSSNFNHTYNEPQQIRAKGCGKRLKGAKEKALKRGKKLKERRCNGCGLVGQAHDKRNCPVLNNRDKDGNSETSSVASSSEEMSS